jgi:hypothetical protein
MPAEHGVAGRMARIKAATGISLRQHAGVIALIMAITVGAILAGFRAPVSVGTAIAQYVPTYLILVPASAGFLLLVHGFLIMVRQRPARPLTVFIRDIRDRFLTVERLATALPLLVSMPLFVGSFTFFKAIIPMVNAYSWDPTFARWDEVLHFGYAPWLLLEPLFGAPIVTWIVNWLYNFWFFVLSLVWVWQVFSLRDPALRLQFFYALILTWILVGVVAATYFASVGPCYYGLVYGTPDPFAPLMARLHDIDQTYRVWALSAQELLWNSYVERGTGISAMPSMHVAVAFLFFLVARRAARWLGWVFFAYFAVILIGSVHLAWHYAIDGYASVLGVLPIWWLSGRLAAITFPARKAVSAG